MRQHGNYIPRRCLCYPLFGRDDRMLDRINAEQKWSAMRA
jgi:hypothetical protein